MKRFEYFELINSCARAAKALSSRPSHYLSRWSGTTSLEKVMKDSFLGAPEQTSSSAFSAVAAVSDNYGQSKSGGKETFY